MASGRLGTKPLLRAWPATQSLLGSGPVQLSSDLQATAQSTALGASETLPPPWWGDFPTQWVSPGDQAMCKGRGLVSGKGREVEKGSGPGPVGRGKGRYQGPHCYSPGTRPRGAGLPLLPKP